MYSFIISILILIAGYAFYGRLTEKIFGPDDRETPAYAVNDGVDCVPIKTRKALLIQLLNIAGTGPIFGALMGACFGPVVFLWIVFGSILGGAVHDYMSGMISERHGGQSIAQLTGIYLGSPALIVMRVFAVVLLVLTGTVFVTSPAALISRLTPAALTDGFWIVVILIYYVLATLLPIDKVIGRLYPFFGVILIVMAHSGLYDTGTFSEKHSPAGSSGMAVHVHNCSLRSYIRLSRYTVSDDGKMHHERKGGAQSVLRSYDHRIGHSFGLGCCRRSVLWKHSDAE